MPVASSRRHRFALPEKPGRRVATRSLLMVPTTVLASLLAGLVGTFLQLRVFDLDEQQLLSEAGPWGYVAGFGLVFLMLVPAAAGTALGIRARRLGEGRMAIAGMIVNALVAAYLAIAGTANLLLG